MDYLETEIEDIAKLCHEINKSYCEQIGDNTQASWDEAQAWQKQSAIDGVKFHLKNPDSKAEDSHNNWLTHKIKDGWTFGEIKDPEAKTHPCIVPFNKLPLEQQFKDFLFLAAVRTGERLVRQFERRAT